MAENPIEPIHQFQIHDIFSLGDVGGVHFAFTNSALLMVISVAVIATAVTTISSRVRQRAEERALERQERRTQRKPR